VAIDGLQQPQLGGRCRRRRAPVDGAVRAVALDRARCDGVARQAHHRRCQRPDTREIPSLDLLVSLGFSLRVRLGRRSSFVRRNSWCARAARPQATDVSSSPPASLASPSARPNGGAPPGTSDEPPARTPNRRPPAPTPARSSTPVTTASIPSSIGAIQDSNWGRSTGSARFQIGAQQPRRVRGRQRLLAALHRLVQRQTQVFLHDAHQPFDTLGPPARPAQPIEQAQGVGVLQERQGGASDAGARTARVGTDVTAPNASAIAGVAPTRRGRHDRVDDARVEGRVAADGQPARALDRARSRRGATCGPTRTSEKSLVPPPKSATSTSSSWSAGRRSAAPPRWARTRHPRRRNRRRQRPAHPPDGARVVGFAARAQ